MGQQIETVAIAQANVEQQQVVGFLVDGRQGRGVTVGRVELIALLAQPIGHGLEHLPIVVHQQQRAFVHTISRIRGYVVARALPADRRRT